MKDSNANIRDTRALDELNETLAHGADSILMLLDAVKGHLSGVQDNLKSQIDFLANELETAEQALAEAEEALRTCEASQKWDEEEHEYTPSCSYESSAVATAREIRDECKRKYDEGCRIKSDCEREIELYQKDGGIISPSGGEKMLEYLAGDHTDKATMKMQEILKAAEEMSSARVTIGGGSGPAVSEKRKSIEGKPLIEGDKKDRFKNSIHKISERGYDSDYGVRKKEDVNTKCPICHRPILACICGMNRGGSNKY